MSPKSESPGPAITVVGGFFGDERRSEKAAKRDRVQAWIDERLRQAVDAAANGDIENEERRLAGAMREALDGDELFGWKPTMETQQRIADLTERGQIRKSPFLGYADNMFIWEDRITVALPGEDMPVVRRVTAETRAEVLTEGQIRTSSRPTLTRMALGSVLPGTALIPGLAFQKRSTHDDRQLFFIVEQSDWNHISALDPRSADISEMRQVAMSLNAVARRLRTAAEGPTPDARDRTMEQLKKLAKLRESGVLSKAEFEEKKAKLLDEL